MRSIPLDLAVKEVFHAKLWDMYNLEGAYGSEKAYNLYRETINCIALPIGERLIPQNPILLGVFCSICRDLGATASETHELVSMFFESKD